MVLAIVVLVVGHDLDFLAAYGAGYEGALARTGHDPHWESAVATVIAVGVLLGLAATARLAWLIRTARRTRALSPAGRSDLATATRLFVATWARLLVVPLALFVVQENYERALIGQPLPGLAVLAPDSGMSPIVIFAVVSLFVAAVAALFRSSIAALEARIAGAKATLESETAVVQAPKLEVPRPASSILGRKLAGRAPPLTILR